MKTLISGHPALLGLEARFQYTPRHGEGMYYSVQERKQFAFAASLEPSQDDPTYCNVQWCNNTNCESKMCAPVSCDLKSCKNQSSC